jgi:hypothetical protein
MRLEKTGSMVLATALLGACAGKKESRGPGEQVSKPLTVIPLAPEETPFIMLGAPFNSLSSEKLDGFSDEPKSGCVIADEVGTLGGVTSGLETYNMTTITSQEDFFRQIDVGYKAQMAATVKMITAKGSTDLKGMTSIKINKNYSYALVTARKLWQAKQIKKASINPEILSLLKKDNSKFFSLCGDEYLSGFRLVTEAYGVLECKSETREEKKKIDAVLSQSVGKLDSAGTETVFNTAIEEIRKKTDGKCTLYVWQRGGRGTLSDKPESFGTSVLNYVANATIDNAAVTEVVTTPYKKSVITAEFWEMVQNIDLSFKVPRSVIKFWQSEIVVLNEKMQNAIDKIDDEPDPAKKVSMYTEAQKLVDQVQVIQANITRCSEHPEIVASCRDSRAPGDPWPDDPIEED